MKKLNGLQQHFKTKTQVETSGDQVTRASFDAEGHGNGFKGNIHLEYDRDDQMAEEQGSYEKREQKDEQPEEREEGCDHDYEIVDTWVEIDIPSRFTYKCTKCGDSYVD